MKNIVSKLLCIAMALCLLLCLTACGVAGTYVFSEMTVQGFTYTADMLPDLGMDPDDCYVILESDGTGEVNIFGEELDIEWEDNEMWPEENAEDIADFEIDGDELILELPGQELVFVKE